MHQPTTASAAPTAVEAAPQLGVVARMEASIRERWIAKHAQDWGQAQCNDLANHVLRELLAPPKAALDAAGITDAQWHDFVAAAADGK